jgi:hypothetical protein
MGAAGLVSAGFEPGGAGGRSVSSVPGRWGVGGGVYFGKLPPPPPRILADVI